MELDAEPLAAVALVAAVIVALAWRWWFGPSQGSSGFDTDSDEGGGDGD